MTAEELDNVLQPYGWRANVSQQLYRTCVPFTFSTARQRVNLNRRWEEMPAENRHAHARAIWERVAGLHNRPIYEAEQNKQPKDNNEMNIPNKQPTIIAYVIDQPRRVKQILDTAQNWREAATTIANIVTAKDGQEYTCHNVTTALNKVLGITAATYSHAFFDQQVTRIQKGGYRLLNKPYKRRKRATPKKAQQSNLVAAKHAMPKAAPQESVTMEINGHKITFPSMAAAAEFYQTINQ